MFARTFVTTSSDVDPGGTGTPGGRFAKGSDLCGRSSSGRVRPALVVLPSKNGSESARSIRRGRPLTSVPLRFRTAAAAVSWSENVLKVRWRHEGLVV